MNDGSKREFDRRYRLIDYISMDEKQQYEDAHIEWKEENVVGEPVFFYTDGNAEDYFRGKARNGHAH